MDKSTRAELTLLNSMSTSNLRVRQTTIAVPPGMESNLSDYFNNSNILAVRGEKESKVHHCYLVGTIPDSDVPDPSKHIVIEFLYNNINEELLPDNPKMPTNIPSKIAGFAMLVPETRAIKAKPASMDIFNTEHPELNEETSTYVGNTEGGVYVTSSGDTEIVASGGSNVKVGKTLDKGDTSITSTADGFTSPIWVKNIINDNGMPNVLPLAPVTFDPFPNIPGIAALYVKLGSQADLISTIKKLGETVA